MFDYGPTSSCTHQGVRRGEIRTEEKLQTMTCVPVHFALEEVGMQKVFLTFFPDPLGRCILQSDLWQSSRIKAGETGKSGGNLNLVS